MRLLLDTHIWIWRLLQPERLSPRTEELIADPDNELYLSAISVWETLVLARKGRLQLSPDPVAWVRAALQRTGACLLPVSLEEAIGSERLDGYRCADPADRFLVATAMQHELTLVTADERMHAYTALATVS